MGEGDLKKHARCTSRTPIPGMKMSDDVMMKMMKTV